MIKTSDRAAFTRGNLPQADDSTLKLARAARRAVFRQRLTARDEPIMFVLPPPALSAAVGPQDRMTRWRRATAKAGEDVAAVRLEEIAVARMGQYRRRCLASAAQHAPAAEPRRGVVAIGMRCEARIGLEGAGRPFPDLAPGKARQRERRALPLRLGGKAPSGPAAPGLGLIRVEVNRCMPRIQGQPAAAAPLLPAAAAQAQMGWLARGWPASQERPASDHHCGDS